MRNALDPIHFGHLVVHEHDVECRGLAARHGFLRIGKRFDTVASDPLQQSFDDIQCHVVVFYDANLHATLGLDGV